MRIGSLRKDLGVLILFVPILMAACSAGNTPSETDAKAAYEKEVARRIPGGVAKVESFKKTNGLKETLNGVEKYTLEYQAELSFPNGWMPECVDQSKFNMLCWNAQLRGVSPQKVGARHADIGKIVFEKAENGWRVVGMGD